MRDDAVRVVGERLAQVLFRLLVAAAEQPRHLEVPAAERAIGRALLERRDRASAPSRSASLIGAAILEALAQAERLGERAHVRGDPEVSFGPLRRRARSAGRAGGDAALRARPCARARAGRWCPASSAPAPASRPTRSPSGSPRAAPPRSSAACVALARCLALAVERVGIVGWNLQRGPCIQCGMRRAREHSRDIQYEDAGSDQAAC